MVRSKVDGGIAEMIGAQPFILPMLFAGVFGTLCTSPSIAQEIIAGFEGGPSTGYGFVTPVFSFPLSTSDSVTLKPTASYLYYDTKSGPEETKVTSPGLSLGLGYRYRDELVSVEVGPAVEVLWVSRKSSSGLRTDQTLVGALVAGNVFYQATPLTNLNLNASYDQTNRYLWSRVGVKQRVTDLEFREAWGLLVGAELTGQGNKDVRQYSVGGLLEFAFKSQTSLQLRAGYSWLTFGDHSHESRPYAGVGLYRNF